MNQQWDCRKAAGLPGYFLVQKDNLWGIWSEEKGLILPCRWNRISAYRDGLALVVQEDCYFQPYRWGLVDENGAFVTPCQWEWERFSREHGQRADGSFVNGFAVIQKNGRYGYIDRQGRIISPCIWDYTGSFDAEGNPALVFRRDGNYLEVPGEWCGHNDYFWTYDPVADYQCHPRFENQYCPYGYFYLYPDGRVLTPGGIVTLPAGDPDEALGQGWLKAEPFLEGTAFVQSDVVLDRIDREGEPVFWIQETEKQYDEQQFLADEFSQIYRENHCGFAVVRDHPDAWGNCYRVLDPDGLPISPLRWSHVEDLYESCHDDPIRVYRKQGSNAEFKGIWDEGEYFFRENCPSYLLDTQTGMAYGKGYYFLCRSGKVLTPSGAVTPAAGDLLPDGWEWNEAFLPFTICQNQPRVLLSTSRAITLINGHAMAIRDDGMLCIDNDVDTSRAKWYDAVIPMEIEGIQRPLLVRSGNKWGMLHNREEVLTPCRWIYEEEGETAWPEQKQRSDGSFINGFAIVRDEPDAFGNCYRILDRKGNFLTPYRWAYIEPFPDNGAPTLAFRRMEEYWPEYDYDMPYGYDSPDYADAEQDEETFWYVNGYVYLTRQGEILTPDGPKMPDSEDAYFSGWKEAAPFANPTTWARLHQRYDLLDHRGQVLQHGANIFSWGKLWVIHAYCGGSALYRHSGEVLYPAPQCLGRDPEYRIRVEGSCLLVQCQDQLRLLDEEGRELLRCTGTDLHAWGDNFWLQDTSKHFGLLDRNGTVLLPCCYGRYDYRWGSSAWKDIPTAALVSQNGLWGLADSQGRLLHPCIWEDYRGIRDDKPIRVKYQGLWGCVDARTGALTAPYQWEEAWQIP